MLFKAISHHLLFDFLPPLTLVEIARGPWSEIQDSHIYSGHSQASAHKRLPCVMRKQPAASLHRMHVNAGNMFVRRRLLWGLTTVWIQTWASVTPLTAPISQLIDVFLCSSPCRTIWLRLQRAVIKAELGQRAVACSYKTAGSAHSSGPGYVRFTTRDHGCTSLSTVRPVGPQRSPASSRDSREVIQNDSLFVVNTGMLRVFFLCGLPRMSSPCTHLFWSRGGGCLDGTPHPLLKTYFVPGMFSSCSSLCCCCCCCHQSATINWRKTHNMQRLRYKMHTANNDSCYAWEDTKEGKTNKDTVRQAQR